MGDRPTEAGGNIDPTELDNVGEYSRTNANDERLDMHNNYDGIEMGVHASNDDFTENEEDEDEEFLVIAPAKKTAEVEEIPPEVIEQLKSNLALKQYIGELVKAGIDARVKLNSANGKKGETDGITDKFINAEIIVDNNHKNNKVRRDSCMTKNLIKKSPSDTTIYKQALLKNDSQSNDVINQISNFVENVQINASKQVTPNH